jgi:hypothetical protein
VNVRRVTTRIPGREDAASLGWWVAGLAVLALAGVASPYVPGVLIVVPLVMYTALIMWAQHVTQEEGRVLRHAQVAVAAVAMEPSPQEAPMPEGHADYLADVTITPAPHRIADAWVPQHLRLVPRSRSSTVAVMMRFLHWAPRVRVLRGMDVRVGEAWVDISQGPEQGCTGPQRLRLHLRSKPGRSRQLVYESEVLGMIEVPGDPG